MKLDRNNSPDGKGKYALVKLRSFPDQVTAHNEVVNALRTLERHAMLDYGDLGTDSEFFVMRLKDKFAYKGLMGYYNAILQEEKPDVDYAQDIHDMAVRAGPNNPNCKFPD